MYLRGVTNDDYSYLKDGFVKDAANHRTCFIKLAKMRQIPNRRIAFELE